jgi:hypothetical protein
VLEPKQSGNIDIEKKHTRWYYDTIWIDINNSGGTLKQTVNFSRNINIQSQARTNGKRWICNHKVHSTGLITTIYMKRINNKYQI